MSFLPTFDGKYDASLTEQQHKDATDINKMIKRAARAGGLSHLQKYQGVYGDFSDFDFFEAQNRLARAKGIFEELPAELRREFHNDPALFFEAVATKDVDELRRFIPELAEPGRQFPAPNSQKPPSAASEPQASVPNPPDSPPESDPPAGGGA